MKQVRFYAVDDDLIRVFAGVERGANLQYVTAGVFPVSSTESYSSGMQLPQIGVATADSAVANVSFLVAEKSVPIRPRCIALQNGRTNFCIDQLDNPDTALLTPAGRWEDMAVLYGAIGTASDSKASIGLVKSFERAIKKNFQKVKAFWIGPKALIWLKEGKRLTIAMQSPKDFDLTLG